MANLQLKNLNLNQYKSEINRVMNQGFNQVKHLDNTAKDGVALLDAGDALIKNIIAEDGFFVTLNGKVITSI